MTMTTRAPLGALLGLFVLAACGPEDGGAAQDDALDAAPEIEQATGSAHPANPPAPDWLMLQGADGPERGRYACQDWEGYSIARVQADATYGGDVRASTYFTSQFSVTGRDAYVYHGSADEPGEFAYDAATGSVRWRTGPYSSAPGDTTTIEGIYGVRQSDGTPTMIQIFRDPAYGEAAELCFKYED